MEGIQTTEIRSSLVLTSGANLEQIGHLMAALITPRLEMCQTPQQTALIRRLYASSFEHRDFGLVWSETTDDPFTASSAHDIRMISVGQKERKKYRGRERKMEIGRRR